MQCTSVLNANFFELGQIFEDFGCLSTNIMCGRNMIFRTIQQEATSHSLAHAKCLQRCSCLNTTHSEINGQCIEALADNYDENENGNLQVVFSENISRKFLTLKFLKFLTNFNRYTISIVCYFVAWVD